MKNATSDDTHATCCPEVAQCLRAGADAIRENFAHGARASVPDAPQPFMDQFVNQLPGVLEEVAGALQSGRKIAASAALPPAQTRIDDLLNAHSLLKRTVIDTIGDRLGRPMETSEIAKLTDALDAAQSRDLRALWAAADRVRDIYTDFKLRFSAVSHDVRGGINGVLMMLEVIRREFSGSTIDPAACLADMEVLRRAMLDISSTLEKFSIAERLRERKYVLKPAPATINALLGPALAEAGESAREKGIELQSRVPGDAAIITDPELAGIILRAIIVNAVRYTRRGVVSVDGIQTDAGVTINVQDHGPGIATEKLPDLLNPSRRPSPEHKSAGIGVLLAQQAANAIGATIKVESTPGAGSMFTVHFPPQLPAKPAAGT